MGFRYLSEEELSIFPKYVPYFRNGIDRKDIRANPGIALEMLLEFCVDNR